jgi:transglutaminase-like putative cysteine protease
VTSPPLFLAAAVLFWGWQTGLLAMAVFVAAILEGARLTRWRLDLSRTDFNRLADLTTLVVIGLGVYLFSTAGPGRGPVGGPRAITLLFQWLPIAFALLVAAQVYSAAGRVDATAFFWSLRRRGAAGGTMPFGPFDVTYPYAALCVLSAGAANQRTLAFYVGCCVLAGWALWPVRARRLPPLAWGALLAVVAALGWGGQWALHATQTRIEQELFEYFLRLLRRDADPFQTSTAIGQLGALKLSDRILLRVTADAGVPMPLLLREASYDVYGAQTWYASGAGFLAVPPEADGETWRLGTGVGAERRVRIAAYLPRGRGVLALPANAYQLDRLAVVGLSRNRLGAVKVEEGLGLLRYAARVGDGPSPDGPPTDTDLGIPSREAPAILRVATELDVRGRPPGDAVAVVRDFLAREFRYSTWQRARGEGTTPIEDFLTRTRAGHCEYFATATVLLLRAAGVPARYAVGFSVQEWSWLERVWIVRTRHAHSWALVWLDGAWRELDTTPPSWSAEEAVAAPAWQAVGDLWAWAVYLVSRWRWSEREDGWGRHVGWLLIPLALLLAWRLRARRRVSGGGRQAARVVPAAPRPGDDSEFYAIERRLAAAGLARQPAEPVTAWVTRVQAHAANPGALAALADLHCRYRFDPRGLDDEERRRLRTGVATWLAAQPAAQAPPS